MPLKGFISKFNLCTNPGLTQLWTTWPSAARCNVTICFVRVHVCNCYTFIFGVTNHAGMWCHVKIVNDIEIYPLVCSREYMWLWFKCQVCLYLFEFKNEWCLSNLYSWNKRCEFQQNLRKMYSYHYYKSMFTAVLIFVFKYNVEAKDSFAGCTAFIEVLKIKLIIIFF